MKDISNIVLIYVRKCIKVDRYKYIDVRLSTTQTEAVQLIFLGMCKSDILLSIIV